MGEPIQNEELQFDVGENEEDTTVEMNQSVVNNRPLNMQKALSPATKSCSNKTNKPQKSVRGKPVGALKPSL